MVNPKDRESLDELERCGLNKPRDRDVDEVRRTSAKQLHARERYISTGDPAWQRREESAHASQETQLLKLEANRRKAGRKSAEGRHQNRAEFDEEVKRIMRTRPSNIDERSLVSWVREKLSEPNRLTTTGRERVESNPTIRAALRRCGFLAKK